jgi:flavin reductase (DIM6/NTAB) family NADH-FMN oxidoreductase RutF
MLNDIAKRIDLHPHAIVSAKGKADKFGTSFDGELLGVVEWHMPSGFNPMGYSISLRSDSDLKNLISVSGSFVVNLLGIGSLAAINSLATGRGLYTDAFLAAGLTRQDSKAVDAPSIREAKAVLECEVTDELESGSHTVFVGRVLNAWQR